MIEVLGHGQTTLKFVSKKLTSKDKTAANEIVAPLSRNLSPENHNPPLRRTYHKNVLVLHFDTHFKKASDQFYSYKNK